ncbi:DUF1440 domain-containing protein [Geobacter sp. SVR]|uniref:DUF1440 domain-containing protein n=1 Tax=Geobacter sp. SVR TaxID=2495594 RepID=UPI00143EFDB5|nr:DUF1440 domain-containing protein [Geobacter sp. SVR]BCS53352.1 hypothetical protein GSVR_16600 [Geobacter sp. SVR]GCF85522.1 hypothetical protein GSbR_21220 [Geobacter sp. SVR]
MSNSDPSKTGGHPLLLAAAAGLVAGAVTGQSDRFMNRFVSIRHKLRDRLVREAPAHQLAGPFLASRIIGRRLSRQEKKRARAAFFAAYGTGWGLIYAGMRKRYPRLARMGGLPFAVPFFFFCDGFMAPLLGVSPNLHRIPWQPNVKEMINHIAWTAAAETVHRAAHRLAARKA